MEERPGECLLCILCFACFSTNNKKTVAQVQLFGKVKMFFLLFFSANDGQIPASATTRNIYGIFGIIRLISGWFLCAVFFFFFFFFFVIWSEQL